VATGIPQKDTCDGAQITVDTAPIRFRTDGGLPEAASLGHVVGAGDMILLENRNELRDFRAIRTTAVSGILNITYTEGKN
jgi:hypothetical protein